MIMGDGSKTNTNSLSLQMASIFSFSSFPCAKISLTNHVLSFQIVVS